MGDSREQAGRRVRPAAPTYDARGRHVLRDVGERLVERAALQPGERVVDMGCGRGAALFPAAARSGPPGRVHGLDIAPTMVELTRGDIVGARLAQVSVDVDDAAATEAAAAATTTCVLSSLVVFSCPIPPPACGPGAATVDGGRLAVSTFADRNDERWALARGGVALPRPVGDQSGATKDDAGPFSSAELLHGLLAGIGLGRWHLGRGRAHRRGSTTRTSGCGWSWSHGMRQVLGRPRRRRPGRRRGPRQGTPAAHAGRAGGLVLRMRVRYTTASAR